MYEKREKFNEIEKKRYIKNTGDEEKVYGLEKLLSAGKMNFSAINLMEEFRLQFHFNLVTILKRTKSNENVNDMFAAL